MQQVQLQINEQGLLRNQRYAFSNRYTLASLLRDVKLEKYPLLKGKTFRLTVGSASGEHAIELLE